MSESAQKPFLTVETGEAYQPIRLTYEILQKNTLIDTLNRLACCEDTGRKHSWNWFWRDDCEGLQFESIDAYQKNEEHPVRLGSLTIKGNSLYINLPSFKRACLALPFFYRHLPPTVVTLRHADFINKVFGLDERLPRGFAEIFNDTELQDIVDQRVADFEKTQHQCEHAESAEDAFRILETYAQKETKKKLPFAERHVFLDSPPTATDDPDGLFLGFYIFLRSRELVAIRRWYGNANYSLADAAEESMEKVFGEMNIDIIE